jgi:hypothetical protein
MLSILFIFFFAKKFNTITSFYEIKYSKWYNFVLKYIIIAFGFVSTIYKFQHFIINFTTFKTHKMCRGYDRVQQFAPRMHGNLQSFKLPLFVSIAVFVMRYANIFLFFRVCFKRIGGYVSQMCKFVSMLE